MLGIDPRSFIIISTCLAALCAFVCFVLRRSIPRDIKGLTSWGTACLVMVASSLLFALVGSINIFASSYLANVLVVTGIALMQVSMRRFADLPPQPWLLVGAPLLVAVLLVQPTFLHDDYAVRIVIVSTVNAALFMYAAKILWGTEQRGFAVNFTATVFALTALVSVVRCIAALNSPSTVTPLTDASSVQYLYLATFAFSMVALSLGFILMVSRKLQVRLETAFLRDGLTGIATRTAFFDLASIELRRASRHRHPTSLLMIDLDDFKTVNDRHGHRIGDLVLTVFAQNTQRVLRSHDLFGRYGGEEFVILLPETDHEAALRIANRVCDACRQAAQPEGTPDFTASIGLATAHDANEDISSILDRADIALYQAKAAGKDRVVGHCEVADGEHAKAA